MRFDGSEHVFVGDIFNEPIFIFENLREKHLKHQDATTTLIYCCGFVLKVNCDGTVLKLHASRLRVSAKAHVWLNFIITRA